MAVEYHSAAILVMKVKHRSSEWSLWSGQQTLWMYAGNEFAHRLAAKGAEAHQHSEWTVERRVATVTLHMAEQYPNKSISCFLTLQSLGSVHHWKSASAHEIVAGRRIGSVKCMRAGFR